VNIDTFEPLATLRTLAAHQVEFVVIGGYAAALHGSPVMTYDADICPSAESANLRRLCAALEDLHARLRTATEPDGVAFRCDENFLARMDMLSLVTDHGALDLSFRPSGTRGYDDLIEGASSFDVGGFMVSVAAIKDIIRSKEAAGRQKDQYGLVHLYAMRDEIAAQERERRPRSSS
jgi:hypothetical protein